MGYQILRITRILHVKFASSASVSESGCGG